MNDQPRCIYRGCPVIYRSGKSRACPMHTEDAQDTMLGRMAAFSELAAAPGEREHDGTSTA